jgi:ABC-type polar amino acid transport system ATPase subunit
MCVECQNLQNKIMRYREMIRRALDPLTTERVNALIKELEQRKETMH